jgi:hypothetical protein
VARIRSDEAAAITERQLHQQEDNVDLPEGKGNLEPRSPGIAELAAEPDAIRWAEHCAWIPGTGYCSNQPCSIECLFRAQRDAEAAGIIETRRQRRDSRRPHAERKPQLVSLLAVVAQLGAIGWF